MARGLKIAISGAGIAGPALAYWLCRGGHSPTLIEAAPRLRTGGYMIDFWGVGYDVAERMGLAPAVRAAGYDLQEVRYVDGGGRTAAHISAQTMARELGDRFTSLPRGDLAALVYEALNGDVATWFGVTIERIVEGKDGVRVGFSDGSAETFDLVIGADGLHSTVRRLTFGPDEQFERHIGYYVAAFDAEGYRPRDELAYVSYGYPGRQISRFAQRGDRTMFLFVFAAEHLGGPEPSDVEGRKATLLRVFADAAWEWPAVKQALADADDIYFDRVSQISMPAWSKGRVALVGDAGACVSLVAGEGTGLGMTEAYVLAGELCRSTDHLEAFATYERRLRSFIEGKQKAARAFASSFTPRTSFGVWFRNQAAKLMAIPGVPGLLVGAQMRDDFALPRYGFEP
ncbi:MAG TPA: FAD-binding domain [Caulobacteraceae bacterium]|nr:FAD-binding domain [Caulobacteraceae bacterium]